MGGIFTKNAEKIRKIEINGTRFFENLRNLRNDILITKKTGKKFRIFLCWICSQILLCRNDKSNILFTAKETIYWFLAIAPISLPLFWKMSTEDKTRWRFFFEYFSRKKKPTENCTQFGSCVIGINEHFFRHFFYTLVLKRRDV